VALKFGYFGKQMTNTLKVGRMDKISWTNRVKNEVLPRDKEAKNTLQAITHGRLTGLFTSDVCNVF